VSSEWGHRKLAEETSAREACERRSHKALSSAIHLSKTNWSFG